MATIVIVNDDPKLLKMLQRTLAYEGFRVFTASSKEEALAEVQAHRPDVVVLDCPTPAMDSIGILEQLHTAEDKMPILMLTAPDGVEDRDRMEGLESIADAYLAKSFAPKQFLAQIRALLKCSVVAKGTRCSLAAISPSIPRPARPGGEARGVSSSVPRR